MPSAISALARQTQNGLLARIPDSHINSANAPRTPNTQHYVSPESKAKRSSSRSICKGSAFQPAPLVPPEPSNLRTSSPRSVSPLKMPAASIRFSLGRHTTESEINSALEAVPAAVAQLRELSPTYRKEATASRKMSIQ